MNHELLRAELIRDEGMRFEAYKDSVGLWTIGVGHLLGKEQRMTKLTGREVKALLDGDIDDAVAVVNKLAPRIWDLPYSSGAGRALVNMAFNLGEVNLSKFKKFLAAIEARDLVGAGKEMMASKWAKQVGKRAERLRDMVIA